MSTLVESNYFASEDYLYLQIFANYIFGYMKIQFINFLHAFVLSSYADMSSLTYLNFNIEEILILDT